MNLQQAIHDQILVLSEEEMRRVLHFMTALRQPAEPEQSLGELLDDCFRDVPLSILNDLPEDAAASHDHYLYGAGRK
ncbi:MAG: hypothetical protein ACKV2V_27840 [Blastocatellia bacterium]